MNLQELAEKFVMTKPFNYNATFNITSNQATDTKTIQIGSDDFLAQEILISGTDSDGDDILDNASADVFRINIINESGEGYTKEPISLRALKELVKSVRFKGWVFRSMQKLTVEISTNTFPASNKNTYPVQVQVNFLGYRLK